MKALEGQRRGKKVMRFMPYGQHYPLINRRNLDQNVGQKNSKRWQSPTLTDASRDFTADLKGTGILQRGVWGVLIMQGWTYR